MDKIYFTFRSITPAQRSERILRAGGVDCVLLRTPKPMQTRGCGYCLRLRKGTEEKAMALLAQARLSYERVYVQNAQAEPEELWP